MVCVISKPCVQAYVFFSISYLHLVTCMHVARFLVPHSVLQEHGRLSLFFSCRVHVGCVSVAGSDSNCWKSVSGSFELERNFVHVCSD